MPSSSSNGDDIHNNYHVVKCVVVGDTAVGKTKLICGGVLGSAVPVDQLLASHIPTVWAVDHYRNRREVMRRSMMNVDGVNVSLQLWDTFGDHEKDRKYAYQRSNVVLLCFNVSSPKSYQHVITKWFPEIRRYCPNTPILLVGCKTDLRYLHNDASFLQYMKQKSPNKKIPETPLISREQGRELATEIGACYYEASAYSLYGIECVFENLVRLALISRRSQKFWLKKLRNVAPPILQIPFCPEKPKQPALRPVSASTFKEDIASLMGDDYGPDFALAIDEHLFYVHRLVLASSSSYFKRLFTMPEMKDYNTLDLPSFRRMSLEACLKSLAYQYTGELELGSSEILTNFDDIAKITDVKDLRKMAYSKSCEELNEHKAEISYDYVRKLQEGFSEMGLEKKMFVDIAFEVDDGMCYAHRAILLARCDAMKAMFGENFIERSLEIILFPGTTKEAFDICLRYLYTDAIEGSITIENALGVIVLANRLCLFRLVTLVELQVIKELNVMIEKNKYISDIVLLLLEPTELHNAIQLFNFCQYYILTNYYVVSIFSADLLENLSQDTQVRLKKFRWPPLEVHREQVLYEKLVRERERAARRARRFAFWKTAKKTANNWIRCALRRGGPENDDEDPKNAAEDTNNAVSDVESAIEAQGNAAEDAGNAPKDTRNGVDDPEYYHEDWELAV